MLNCKATSTPVAIGGKLSSQGDFEKVSESTYRSLVGCLLYLIASRPDIMFAVSLLSRFMHCCNEKHFQTAKRVLRVELIGESIDLQGSKVRRIAIGCVIGSRAQLIVLDAAISQDDLIDHMRSCPYYMPFTCTIETRLVFHPPAIAHYTAG
ncbi:uncharacterized protein [Gossypium hirsutum]|uniref:Uncharacterized protein n=1 Tax=Gossypium hirsutum TaxID=3635 RepID=A0ABM3BLQ7_GOSHI|nr:uncharacterized protein LOC121228993 [Gossypium hirsutum]